MNNFAVTYIGTAIGLIFGHSGKGSIILERVNNRKLTLKV